MSTELDVKKKVSMIGQFLALAQSQCRLVIFLVFLITIFDFWLKYKEILDSQYSP